MHITKILILLLAPISLTSRLHTDVAHVGGAAGPHHQEVQPSITCHAIATIKYEDDYSIRCTAMSGGLFTEAQKLDRLGTRMEQGAKNLPLLAAELKMMTAKLGSGKFGGGDKIELDIIIRRGILAAQEVVLQTEEEINALRNVDNWNRKKFSNLKDAFCGWENRDRGSLCG